MNLTIVQWNEGSWRESVSPLPWRAAGDVDRLCGHTDVLSAWGPGLTGQNVVDMWGPDEAGEYCSPSQSCCIDPAVVGVSSLTDRDS